MRGLAGAGPGAAAAVETSRRKQAPCPGARETRGDGGGGGLSQAPSLGAPMKMDTRDVAKGSASPDAWQGPPGRLEGCP